MESLFRTGRGLNANQLKLIAVAAMVVDHCTAFLFPLVPGAWLLRLIGRLTAPIMCFFIAEGFAHTSNLRRYLGRLLASAVVSHVPFVLCHGGMSSFWNTSSVMWTLFLGLAALVFSANPRYPVWLKCIVVLACCALAWRSDWSWYAILWILGFGLFRQDRKRAFAVFRYAQYDFSIVATVNRGRAYSATSRIVGVASPFTGHRAIARLACAALSNVWKYRIKDFFGRGKHNQHRCRRD